MVDSLLILVVISDYPCCLHATGVSAKDKISALREILAEKKATGMVISMLDEVAWLFNLRGSDIEFNPGKSPLLRCFPRMPV